jgi:chitinase
MPKAELANIRKQVIVLACIWLLMASFLSFPSDLNAAFYDFESGEIPETFRVDNPKNYPGVIGTTTARFHEGQKSFEISSPSNTSESGKGVIIPLSGDSGHISWWQYDQYGSNSPIYMQARLTTDTGNYFDMLLADRGWGGLKSGNYNITINDVQQFGPARVAGAWSKLDLYIVDGALQFYVNDIFVATAKFSGRLDSLHFWIIGYYGGGDWIDSLQIDTVSQSRRLNLVVGGSGSGFVSLSPLNSVINGSISTSIASGAQVTLSPTPSEFSVFTGWGGACTGQGDCAFAMDSDKTVYATFDKGPNPVRINLPSERFLQTLQDAYTASATGADINAWGIAFPESLVLNEGKHVRLAGGCNRSYSECSGMTTLNGRLIVKNGSVRIRNIQLSGEYVNHQPTANAGVSRNITAGATITLDGSLSHDEDNDPLTYNWTLKSKPLGSNSAITGATSVNPVFVADVAGDYVVQLIVSDGKTSSSQSLVTISATLPNQVPVASAGLSRSVTTGVKVTLDGGGSADADGDPLTYRWSLTSRPAGSNAALADATAVNPTFTPDVAGPYNFSLVVDDGKAASSAATVTITAGTSSLELSQVDPFWGSVTVLPLPYFPFSSPLNNNMTSVFSGTDYTTVATFTLTAKGGNFTIYNLTATNSSNSITPYFVGLADGQTLSAGTSVTFSLASPHTYGTTVSLCYRFQIAETKDTFTYNVSLKTN